MERTEERKKGSETLGNHSQVSPTPFSSDPFFLDCVEGATTGAAGVTQFCWQTLTGTMATFVDKDFPCCFPRRKAAWWLAETRHEHAPETD